MDPLKEQLKQLNILNNQCDGGYVRTATCKVAALVDNLQQNVCAEKNDITAHLRTKTAPSIPPKPLRKTSEMPEVPLSKLVTDAREPLYSQPLQSLELARNKGTVSESASMLLRKQHFYVGQTEENARNSQRTLDNPAVLEQQLEALAYHKLQMEKKGLLGLQVNNQSAKTIQIATIPKLSSTSLRCHNFISQVDLIYNNLETKTKPTNIQMSKRPENIGNCNTLYSNLQQICREKDLRHPSVESKLLSISTNPVSEKDFEEDLPPPPSPVSSSYSELRRASDVYNNVADFQADNASKHNIAAIPHKNYANQYAHNVTHKGYQGKMCTDYYGYGGLSQSSSTYDSIYEPINPRPPSDMSLRTNSHMYASYINQSSIPSSSTCGANILIPSAANTPKYCSGSGGLTAETNNPNGINSPRNNIDIDESMNQYHLNSIDSVESYGRCFKCGERVLGENSGCTAMDQIYHISCFTCTECQINLQGKPFYALEGKPFCEYDYLQTLEKCSVCLKPILERILRATGKPYHPQCFTCVVCGNSLDAIPFTVDATNQNYCITDFHKKFAPRCCVCKEPIMPEPGQEETVRVVALDRSFHLECYKCEDCSLLLSSEADGRGCYPLDDHVLCKSCNAQRVQALTNRMTSDT